MEDEGLIVVRNRYAFYRDNYRKSLLVLLISVVANVVLGAIGRPDLKVVALPSTPGSPARRCPDMKRTIDFTEFRPVVNLEEGVRRTYKWYSDNVFSDGGVSAI